MLFLQSIAPQEEQRETVPVCLNSRRLDGMLGRSWRSRRPSEVDLSDGPRPSATLVSDSVERFVQRITVAQASIDRCSELLGCRCEEALV